MTSHYEEYAILDAQIKELNNKKDSLKVQILEDMIANEEDKISTSVGSFSIAKLKSWTYTDKVDILKQELDAQKASEESTGEATFEEKPSLRFTGIKL